MNDDDPLVKNIDFHITMLDFSNEDGPPPDDFEEIDWEDAELLVDIIALVEYQVQESTTNDRHTGKIDREL